MRGFQLCSCAAHFAWFLSVRSLFPSLQKTGRLEEFAARVEENPNLRLVKGKVARVEENAATGDLLVSVEDVLSGRKATHNFELVVLATGMVPQTKGLPVGLRRDDFGFLEPANGRSGIYAAGCVRQPADVSTTVQDATAVALKALQCARRRAAHA